MAMTMMMLVNSSQKENKSTIRLMVTTGDNCGNDYEMAGAPEAAYDTGKPFSISVPYGNQLHNRRHHCHLKSSLETHILSFAIKRVCIIIHQHFSSPQPVYFEFMVHGLIKE